MDLDVGRLNRAKLGVDFGVGVWYNKSVGREGHKSGTVNARQ